MNKKIFITVFIIMALGAVSGLAWLVWKDMGAVPEELTPTNEQNTGGLTYEVVAVPEAVSSEKDQEYKDLANEIASQPIKTDNAKTKASIEDICSKIKENYTDLSLWIDLGLFRQSIGDYTGAKEALEFANMVFPKNYVSFQNLGFLYGFYLKDPVQSEKYYMKSLENDPTNAQVYLDLADVYFNYKVNADKIPAFLLGGVKTTNESDKLLLKARLARYYEETKDYANAIKYYEEVLAVDPSNAGIEQEIDRLKTL